MLVEDCKNCQMRSPTTHKLSLIIVNTAISKKMSTTTNSASLAIFHYLVKICCGTPPTNFIKMDFKQKIYFIGIK